MNPLVQALTQIAQAQAPQTASIYNPFQPALDQLQFGKYWQEDMSFLVHAYETSWVRHTGARDIIQSGSDIINILYVHIFLSGNNYKYPFSLRIANNDWGELYTLSVTAWSVIIIHCPSVSVSIWPSPTSSFR